MRIYLGGAVMKRLFLMAMIFCTLISAGCNDGKTVAQPASTDGSLAEQAIRVQLAVPVESIDPAYVQNESEIAIAKMIFQGLVMENSKGEVVPCAAGSWQISSDQKTYLFHLRQKIIFHNGKAVTAADFKYSWERVLRLNAPAAYLFANIQGAAEVLDGQQILVSGIQASDDRTLSVTLIKPQPNFLATLCHPATAVLDRYELVEQGIAYAKPGTVPQPALIPSGIGPFRLIEWIDGQLITLGRNPQYFTKKAALSRVDFLMNQPVGDGVFAFATGRVQILQDLIPGEMAKLPAQVGKIALQKTPIRQVTYLGMNANLAPFNVKEIRDAVCYALNPKNTLQSVRGDSGAVLTGLLTDYWNGQKSAFQTPFRHYLPSAAAALIRAGNPSGTGLAELNLFCGPSVEDRLVAGVVSKSLTAAGFKVKISPVPGRDLRRLIKNGEAAIYIASFSALSPELDNFFHEQIDSRWQKTIINPLWDQLLDGAASLDGEEQQAVYRQLEQEVLVDSRICYLFTYQTASAVSDRLENYQVSRGGNIDFETLSLKPQTTAE